MAKTVDITTLGGISKNSALLFGKSSDNKVGFVEGTFDENGKLVDVVEAIKNLATKDEIKQFIPSVVSQNGDVAYMNNEANGGLIKLTKKDGSMSKVTLFDGSDENKTMMQLIVHSPNKSEIAKINANTTGFYYIKEDTNTPKPENELATKKDVNVVGNEVDSLDGRVESAEDSITEINKKISELEKLKEQFEALSSKVSTIETNVSSNTSGLQSLRSQVEELSANYSKAIQQVNTYTDNVKQLLAQS